MTSGRRPQEVYPMFSSIDYEIARLHMAEREREGSRMRLIRLARRARTGS